MIWGQLNQRIQKENTSSKCNNKVLIKVSHEDAETNVEAWQNSAQHIVWTTENKYGGNHINSLVIQLNEDIFSDSNKENLF